MARAIRVQYPEAIHHVMSRGGRRQFSLHLELLDQMHEHLGGNHVGPGKSESAEQRAERILAGELKHLRWREGDLKNHRKGDPRKVRIAVQLRKESTVTLKWIARRLAMGAWSHLSYRLYWAKREPNDRK